MASNTPRNSPAVDGTAPPGATRRDPAGSTLPPRRVRPPLSTPRMTDGSHTTADPQARHSADDAAREVEEEHVDLRHRSVCEPEHGFCPEHRLGRREGARGRDRRRGGRGCHVRRGRRRRRGQGRGPRREGRRSRLPSRDPPQLSDQASTQQRRAAGALRSTGDELAGWPTARHRLRSGDQRRARRRRADPPRRRLAGAARTCRRGVRGPTFARRHTGAFLAIAVGVGLLAGRLTRALVSDARDNDRSSDRTLGASGGRSRPSSRAPRRSQAAPPPASEARLPVPARWERRVTRATPPSATPSQATR